jgi:hypothetical protein
MVYYFYKISLSVLSVAVSGNDLNCYPEFCIYAHRLFLEICIHVLQYCTEFRLG